MKVLLPLTALIATAAAAATACVDQPIPVGTRGEGQFALVVDVPPEINRDLDLLFVVDNTRTMAARQLALEHSFANLIAHLEFAEGGMPNLHIGVVSTDLGAAGYEVPGCGLVGDAGALQAEPRVPGCEAPTDAFIRDYQLGVDELRDTNYGGPGLTEAFQCVSLLGTEGCSFEQPLESMRLALDGFSAANQGFNRPNAALGVVILTDEDDCSVTNPGLFDPMLDGTNELSKFRCFSHGVTCEGDDVRLEGEYTDCIPKEDSQYLASVASYARFVDGLKADPTNVVVTGMIGEADLVEVQVTVDDRPQLVPACSDSSGDAYPAVRLQHFLDQTRQGGEVSPLCGSQPLGALSSTARKLRKVLGTHCLDGDLVDADDELVGLQPDCFVYDRAPDGTTTDIPACANPSNPQGSAVVPCYAIKTGPAECGDFMPHQLALQVWRGRWDAAQPPGTHTLGKCLVK
ncbi:MAG TPA: hypothetical protein VML75_12460 [Kofleriaceae bacterium]|nr:hypothetical protein [Kofleriaceae bacterium]